MINLLIEVVIFFSGFPKINKKTKIIMAPKVLKKFKFFKKSEKRHLVSEDDIYFENFFSKKKKKKKKKK